MAHPVLRLVPGARHGSAEVREHGPQRGRGVRQPEVDLVVLPEGGEQLDLGGGDPGVPEQREPFGEVGGSSRLPAAQVGEDVAVALARRGGRHAGHEAAPELGLPGEVVLERSACSVGVAAGLPVVQEGGPLGGVRGEEAGQATRHGVPPAAAQLPLLAVLAVPEVEAQRVAPRLSRVGVDDLEQRPDEGVGRPRVLLVGAGDRSATRLRGDRNRTPAQTPSSRPSAGPRRCESRWDSHRSTPLAGTITSSWANGSGSGVRRRSASPSRRRSARGARWRSSGTMRSSDQPAWDRCWPADASPAGISTCSTRPLMAPTQTPPPTRREGCWSGLSVSQVRL